MWSSRDRLRLWAQLGERPLNPALVPPVERTPHDLGRGPVRATDVVALGSSEVRAKCDRDDLTRRPERLWDERAEVDVPSGRDQRKNEPAERVADNDRIRMGADSVRPLTHVRRRVIDREMGA